MELAADTYFSYLLRHTPTDVWNVFLLGLARIVPTIAFVPFLGGKLLPDTLKIGFGVALTVLFLPILLAGHTTPIVMDTQFMLLLVKEAVLGSTLGFIMSMPFYYAQGAGALIDHQRGSQSLQVMDPSTQMQTSPTGTLYNNLMLVAFFSFGGPLLFFDALVTSFQIIPFDHFLPAHFFELQQPFWIALLEMLSLVVKMSLQLSAPAILAILLSDLFLGIANRMAPEVQISFLLWSLKALVGIAILWVSWWFVFHQIEVEAKSWMTFFTNLTKKLV